MKEKNKQIIESIASYTMAGCEHVVGQTINSAVIAALQEIDGVLNLLFEVRAANLQRQPGEICFPGGKIEQKDADPTRAAVRETCEELGITDSDIAIIGDLPRIISPVGATVWPYVGLIGDTEINPQKTEVAEVLRIPLEIMRKLIVRVGHMEFALRPSEDIPLEWLPLSYRTTDWSRRRRYPVLFYRYGNHIIWGITAQIVHDLLTIMPDDI